MNRENKINCMQSFNCQPQKEGEETRAVEIQKNNNKKKEKCERKRNAECLSEYYFL